MDVSLLQAVPEEGITSAREAVWNSIGEFEAALQHVARLPEHFRLMMTPVENAVGSMALLRNRLELSETALAEEAQRTAALQREKSDLAGDLAQARHALKQEEAVVTALRQQNAALDSAHIQLVQDYEALQRTLSQLEPQLRELSGMRDALQAEVGGLRQAKDLAEKTISDLQTELGSTIDTLSDRSNTVSHLQLANERLRERLDTAGKSISELECAVMQLQEKYNAGKMELSRERKTSATLRIENLQLRKDAEAIRAQGESETETLRARHQFLEKALADSRTRFAEESRQLSQARLERGDRDREVGRLKLALETAQRESNALRAQLDAASQSSSASGQMLIGELETRHRLELEIDMLRNENSTLVIKQKNLLETARLDDIAHGETVAKLQARLARLAHENDQLRAVMRVANDPETAMGVVSA